MVRMFVKMRRKSSYVTWRQVYQASSDIQICFRAAPSSTLMECLCLRPRFPVCNSMSCVQMGKSRLPGLWKRGGISGQIGWAKEKDRSLHKQGWEKEDQGEPSPPCTFKGEEQIYVVWGFIVAMASIMIPVVVFDFNVIAFGLAVAAEQRRSTA